LTETVDGLLERFTALHPRVIDLSLGRIEALLDKLGRPQDRLPPVIHVAGTNGKGSVLAFCRAAFEAAGLSVHQYVSPHLVRFNERMVLGGQEIDDDRLYDALGAADAANDGAPITFFEITTAAAFHAFAQAPADVLLLETGLGGRLDATNVVDHPVATAIVSIDFDHQGYLGDTLEAIAGEKAGILRRDVPALVGDMPEAARAVILEKAREAGAPVQLHGKDWTYTLRDDGWTFSSSGRTLDLPLPALPGAHQPANAALAIALADAADLTPLDDAHWRTAMTSVRWPGRLQRLTDGPLVESLHPGQELWVDGAHNPAAAQALAAWVGAQDRPLHAILGLLESKDPVDVLGALALACASITAVPIPGHQCFPPDRLVAEATAHGNKAAQAASDLRKAIKIASAADPAGIILICGSLYLVGQALAESGY